MLESILQVVFQGGFILLGIALLIAFAPVIVFIAFLGAEIGCAMSGRMMDMVDIRPLANFYYAIQEKAERGREGTFPFFTKFYGGSWRFILTMVTEARDFINERREAY